MRAVGVREFKTHLSQHLRAVRAGETLLVTDRGEVVAEVRPPVRQVSDVPYPVLLELAERGAVELGAPNSASAYPEMPRAVSDGRSRTLLDEERGPR